ncbi:hypothetical protein [Glycomyces paridis]|uniref:Uncharacterized protein n=1 Tax=Glycomyces paridis TaxID=2126555 RepID=A0A4S8PFE7_9ACTN|nr:hypothetical protein [Glycomyces paridis]THV28375.1 hypothetical protein E9998_12265 [Glycomyces paridis]
MSDNEHPSVTAHPASPHPVVTDTRPGRIKRSEGLLEVTIATTAPTEPEGPGREAPEYPPSRVPILLVDSRPVAQGVGTAWVRLPPGMHRCSVQAGGFAGWWVAEVTARRTTVLESHPDRAWEPGGEPPLAPDTWAGKTLRRADEAGDSAPAASQLPFTLDRLPDHEPKSGGLLLDLTWEAVSQHVDPGTGIDRDWLRRSGEPWPPRERPWMPDPVVTIDGARQELDWGRWWIPLRPGGHGLEVAVAESGPSAGTRRARWRTAVDVHPGSITRARINAQVVQHSRPERTVLRTSGFDARLRSNRLTERLPDFREPRTR